MKALVVEDFGRAVFKEVPMPAIAEDEALVRIRACAICGSDLHGYCGRTNRRTPPVIMGHEASGEIVKVGGGVADFKVGDRVAFNSTLYCGKCWYCNHGRQNLCQSSRVFGVNCPDYKLDGAMAEYVAIPERILCRLPDSLDYVTAALAEPLSIALHAVGRTPIGLDETAAVVGSGAIGMMLVKALRVAGCASVLSMDISEARLAHAKQAGASETLNTANPDWRTRFAALYPLGVDHAFEAVGAGATVNDTIFCAKRGGTVTLVGNAQPSAPIDFQKIVLKELNVIGSYACATEYETALRLMASGRVDVSDTISAAAPMEEGQRWLSALAEGKQDLVKVVLTL